VPPALEAQRAQARLLGWALSRPAVRGGAPEAGLPARAKELLEERAAALEQEAAALRRLAAGQGQAAAAAPAGKKRSLLAALRRGLAFGGKKRPRAG